MKLRSLNRPRRRAGLWPAALALLLLLAACTGTRETQLPTLLVIGSGGQGSPHLMLVQDLYDPTATPPRSLTLVEGSEQPLPAPPVALDVVDRLGRRSELVVLLRDEQEETSLLHFFDVSALDPEDGNSFVPSRAPVDLTALLAAEPDVATPICPTEVAAGAEGRYIALLDSGACRPGGIADIYVVDVVAGKLLFSLSAEHPAVEVLPAGIFVDQETDTLYFAAASLARTEIRSLPLTGADQTTPVGSVEIDPSVVETGAIARVAGGIAVVGDNLLALVPVAANSEPQTEPATTLPAARALIADPAGALEELVVLSQTRAAIHQGPADSEPEEMRLHGPPVATTLEPSERFAYLLEPGGVEILDLFPYAEPPATRLLFVEIDGLSEPSVITWVQTSQAALATP